MIGWTLAVILGLALLAVGWQVVWLAGKLSALRQRVIMLECWLRAMNDRVLKLERAAAGTGGKPVEVKP